MKKQKKMIVIGLTSLLLIGISFQWIFYNKKEKVSEENYVATIAGHIIIEEDIDAEYTYLLGESEHTFLKDLPSSSKSSVRHNILKSILERKLIYSFIEKENPSFLKDLERKTCKKSAKQFSEKNPKIKASSNKIEAYFCETFAIKNFIAQHIYKEIDISEKEISEYYENNKEEFFSEAEASVRHILFIDEPTAKKIRPQLTSQNFIAFVEKYSIAPEKEQKGMLAPLKKGEMPQVFEFAFTMQEGQISEILKSTYGFHVIKLEKIKPSQTLPLAQVKDSIKQYLREEKAASMYQKYLNNAVNSFEVQFKPT